MLALLHHGNPGDAGVHLAHVADPHPPGAGEVTVTLLAAGLNRHELFQIDRRTPNDAPQILGADGTGSVTAIGSDVPTDLLNTTVLLDPCIGWESDDMIPAVPAMLGDPYPGTFAQRVTVPATNVYPVPDHLSTVEAACLGLSAATAYRGLFTKGGLRKGEHVVVTGFSGGVGPLATALAVAVGAEVTVTTRTTRHRERAERLGAHHVIADPDSFDEQLTRRADIVFDGVGARSIGPALRALRPGGRLVTYGATTGAGAEISLRDLFFTQVDIRGTSMANQQDFAAMLSMVTTHRIAPAVDHVAGLRDAAGEIEKSRSSAGFGKTVFTMEEL